MKFKKIKFKKITKKTNQSLNDNQSIDINSGDKYLAQSFF